MRSTNLSPMSFRFDIGDNVSKQRNPDAKPLILMPKFLKSFDLSSWNQFLPTSPSRSKSQFNLRTNEVTSMDSDLPINQSKYPNSDTKPRVPFTCGKIEEAGVTNLDPRLWNMSVAKETKLKAPKGLKWPLFLASRVDKSNKHYSDLDLFNPHQPNTNIIFDENLSESDLKESVDGNHSDSDEHLSVIKQNVLSLREDFNILLHELLGRNRSKDNISDFGYQFGNDPIFDVSNNSPSRPIFDKYRSESSNTREYNKVTRSPKFGAMYEDEFNSERSTPTKSKVNNPFSQISPNSNKFTESNSSKRGSKGGSTPFRRVSNHTPLAESYQDMGKVDTSEIHKRKSPRKSHNVHFKSSNTLDNEASSVDSYRLPRFGSVSPEKYKFVHKEISRDNLVDKVILREEIIDYDIQDDDMIPDDIPNDATDDLPDDAHVIQHDSPLSDDDEVQPQGDLHSPMLSKVNPNSSSKTPHNSNASDITFHNSPTHNVDEGVTEDYPVIDVNSDVDVYENDDVNYADDTNDANGMNGNNVDDLYDEIDRIVNESVEARIGHSPRSRTSPHDKLSSVRSNKTSSIHSNRTSSIRSNKTSSIHSNRTSPANLYRSVQSKLSISPKNRSPGRPRLSPIHQKSSIQTPSRGGSRTPSRSASVQTSINTPKSIKSKSVKRRINYWTDAFNSSYKVPGAHEVTSKHGKSSIDWDAETESLKRNTRYPNRLRIPMLQHWNADPADPIDLTVQNVIKYSLNYKPSYKNQLKTSKGPKLPHGKALLHISTQPRKRGRPRKYPIDESIAHGQSVLTLEQNDDPSISLENGDRSYIKPGYVALLTLSGKRICYKAVYTNTEDTPDDIEGVLVYPIVMTSVCRTSLLVFPSGGHINFGESNEIFLCGYVSNGTFIQIQSVNNGEQVELNLKTNDTFCIPPNTPCHIYNKDLGTNNTNLHK